YVKSNNFLNVEEMVLFEKRAKSTLNITGYTAIFLLLQTGLRRAEALGLQWGDIDFERHTLSVNRIRDRYGIRTPKTKRSIRTIIIGKPLIKQLTKYQKWCIKIKLKYKKQHNKEDFIFITPHNTLINENLPNNWLKKIYKDYDKVTRV